VNRTDAECVFAIFQNVAGATFSLGAAGVWDTATQDGVRVKTPATATLSCLVGVAAQTIADSAFGLFQVYGYRASAVVVNHTSTAIAAGDILIPVDAVRYLARSAAADGKTGFIYAGEAVATGSATTLNAKVFIRCMAALLTFGLMAAGLL